MKGDPRDEITAHPRTDQVSVRWLWSLGALWLLMFSVLLSRHYFFLFDDFSLVDQAAGTSIPQILTTPLFGFWRPVVFLLVKALACVFSWNRPTGYALVLAAIHGLNGVLLGLVLRSLKLSGLTVLTASALFLLSPWSSEAYSWLSALFDSLAVLVFLLAVMFYIRYLLQSSWTSLLVSAVCLFMALLAKENMIAFLPVFYLVRAGIKGTRISKKAGLEFSFFLAAAFLYLAARSSLVGALGGSYGDLTSLLSRAGLLRNLGQYVLTLFWIAGKSFAWAEVLALIYAAVVLLAAGYAFAKRPAVASAIAAMFVVSLVPVLWNSTRPATSDAGRLLYAPAAFFCALVGIGLQHLYLAVRRGRRLASRRTAVAAILLGLAGAAASAVYQATIWRYACGLSKRTVSYVLRYAPKTDKDIYIKNLPFLFIGGPMS